MHKAILVWIGLLLIGSVSIVQCYSYQGERDSEESLSERDAKKSGDCEEKGEVHSAGAVCSKCKSGQICTVPDICRCPVGANTSPCQIQTAGSCSSAATQYSPAVVSIDFGSGSSKFSSEKPSKLKFTTTYKQITDPNVRVEDGSFALANSVPGLHGTFLSGGTDHTSTDHKGYMMLVNAAYGTSTVLKTRVDDLIVGLRYQFTIYVANVNKKASNIKLPSLLLEAKTTDGTLVASTPTGNIAEESSFTWKKHGMSFITPSSSIVLSIESKAGGGRGDDYALDDVSLVPCQPVDNVVCSGK